MSEPTDRCDFCGEQRECVTLLPHPDSDALPVDICWQCLCNAEKCAGEGVAIWTAN